MTLDAVCVYCGSSSGQDPEYAVAAADVGRTLAACGITLVYGGGGVGLMGIVADAALAAGGRVHGVMTEALVAQEVAHSALDELVVVPSMHERKAAMAAAADAFVVLPGGFGTFDELFEALTWTQLGIHQKPVGLLDVAGYFGPVVDLVTAMVEAGFVRAAHAAILTVDTDIRRLLDALAVWRPRDAGKWVDLDP